MINKQVYKLNYILKNNLFDVNYNKCLKYMKKY